MLEPTSPTERPIVLLWVQAHKEPVMYNEPRIEKDENDALLVSPQQSTVEGYEPAMLVWIMQGRWGLSNRWDRGGLVPVW